MAYTGDLQVIPPTGRGRMNLHVEWYEDSANVTNNTSVIHMSGYIYNPDRATLFETYGNGRGVIRLYWHDNRQGEKYLSADTVVTSLAGYQTINVSGSITVTHNGDGSLLGYGGIEWVKESSLNWMPETCFVNAGGYIALTTIPRAAAVDDYSLDNIKGEYSVTYTRKNSAFREKLNIAIMGIKFIKTIQDYTSGTVIKLNSAEWEDIYETTKNFDRGRCNIGIVLETWTADFKTKIGESLTYTKELTITDSPTLDSIVVTDEGVAKAYIPNVYECMSLLSKKRVKVTANAKKHATIKSITVSVGTFNKTVNTATADVLFDGLTNASGEITYTITATDSRNNVIIWTQKAKYHQYVRPSIINLNVARNGAESSNGAISADGEYWQGKVGNTINAISITITGSATGNTSGLLNGNKWSATKPIGGANPNQAYTYTLTAIDRFGQSISRDITLAIEKALMQLGKTQVDVNGNFTAEDYYFKKNNTYQRMIDFFYPVGSILMNENKDYDPNKLLGGTWEKINDRFLIGASEDTPIKSQGGSATHAHGQRDGRNGNLASAIGAVNNNPGTIGYKAVNDTYIGALGGATYVVASSNISFSSWNHFTAVVGQTAEASTLPPYYAINIWRRVS